MCVPSVITILRQEQNKKRYIMISTDYANYRGKTKERTREINKNRRELPGKAGGRQQTAGGSQKSDIRLQKSE